MTYIFWTFLTLLFCLIVVFDYKNNKIYKAAIIPVIILASAFGLFRELDLYNRPIYSMPPNNVEFVYNFHKLILVDDQVNFMVWLSDKKSHEKIYVFPFEKGQNMKSILEKMKQQSAKGSQPVIQFEQIANSEEKKIVQKISTGPGLKKD